MMVNKLWITDINDICPDFEKAFNDRLKIKLNKNEFINWAGNIIDLSKQRLPVGIL